MWGFPLFPDQASTVAPQVDALYFVLIGLSAVFTLLVVGLLVYFGVKYRRGARADRSRPVSHNTRFELVLLTVPTVLALAVYAWAAILYFNMQRAPANALEFTATGKQWMWKLQHPTGQREINELHIPVGRPIKLTMISQDVIHSFYIPAFRIKQDVLPGRYSTLWFQATKPGEYHLFCTEYCGTEHSEMIGRVVVMEPAQYEAWLGGAEVAQAPAQGAGSAASAGEQQFQQLGCASCHRLEGGGAGPALAGIFGQEVRLQDGQSVTADESYIRESILNPNAKIVEGYQPVMPSFQGQVSEEQILELINYIRSLGTTAGPFEPEETTEPEGTTEPEETTEPAITATPE
ncbi:MAG TPA: cytochrome c oxidase subunit II [Herpetosiphonaceae bacterium]